MVGGMIEAPTKGRGMPKLPIVAQTEHELGQVLWGAIRPLPGVTLAR